MNNINEAVKQFDNECKAKEVHRATLNVNRKTEDIQFMKKNNIALITALYDSNGADLYKEIYCPIIKYSVTKSVLG